MAHRIVTFGEIMLRLSPPGRERFFQSENWTARFGGGEANVAVSLARFGRETSFLTVLPDNPVAEAAIAELRRHGVGTDGIIRRGRRMGIYFAEIGAGPRPSRIVYDRDGSAVSEAGPGDVDWSRAFAGASWFHVTGITPALSRSAADLTIEGMRAAKAAGLTISLDLNYRAKLWRYGASATEVMPGLASLADLLLANEEDCQKALGIGIAPGPDGKLELKVYEDLTAAVLGAFPNLSRTAVTLRASRSADRNGWSAVLRTRAGFLAGPPYEIEGIVDRVGSGDAFAAGFIHGLLSFDDDARALAFAVAASCLKHTVPGDFNLVSEKEVLDLLAGDASGRIRR
ncbi:MAG: sugar kinase [Acidobacteriota bacterium]|nr:sugar kinase [Acidobacteriota bacterium]